MKLTHFDAETRYASLRESALAHAQTQTPVALGLTFQLIDEKALAVAKAWEVVNDRRVINETVRKYYEKFGLQYVSKGDFLFMRLG